MPRTYKAVLSDDGIRWTGEVPEAVLRGEETPVEVVVPEEPAALPVSGITGARLAEIFEKLAATDPFQEIEDPVGWQRAVRDERPLPGRTSE
ncbi:MAG: hypothetical protein AAGI91_11995 [Bacteroidota bacterium]